MMNKNQLNALKKTSLEKAKPNHVISQKKSREAQNVDHSKDGPNSNNKGKNSSKIDHQRAKSKNHFQNNQINKKKGSFDTNQIIMKKDLKMLLSKKGLKKSKEVNIVPDILKKIEENCRILKKIDYQEHHASHKKTSKQSISNSKSFKNSCGNNKSQLPFNKSISKSKETALEPKAGGKRNRLSYEIGREQHNQKKQQLKAYPKNQQGQSTNKLVEAAQQYKKIIERQQLKIEKSSKNTNYNSNQSRNSSSLHNSHALFSILEGKSKQQKLQDTTSNLDKIQGLIKQQQNNIEQIIQPRQSFQQNLSKMPLKQIKDKKQTQLNEEKPRPSINDKKSDIITRQQINSKQKFDGHTVNNASFSSQKQKPIKFFQNSKYYVQPIPPFKGKAKQDSLLGCEITLIQNNIINDSELPQLQL